MGIKLTSKDLDAPAPEKETCLYDSVVPGLVLRRYPSGKQTYCVYTRMHGGSRKPVRVTLGPTSVLTLPQARARAKEELAKIYQGIDPTKEKKKRKETEEQEKQDPQKLTLRDFLDDHYEPWAMANRADSSTKNMIASVKSSFSSVLDKEMKQITLPDADRVRTELRNKGRKTAGDRYPRYLKTILQKAVDWGHIESNPLAKYKPAAEDNDRVRYLSPDELKRLMDELEAREERMREARDSYNEWLRDRHHEELPDLRTLPFADYLCPMVMLSLHTGIRRGELFRLTWDAVNFQARTITVSARTAKTRRARTVPLSQTAFDVLDAWRKMTTGNDLVFPNPATGSEFDNVKTCWRKLLHDAEITDFRWHDMRHHFASTLAMKGVDIYSIATLMGHSSVTMTQRYAHLSPGHLAGAVAVLDEAGGAVSESESEEPSENVAGV